ncbi:hypothetical protein U3516DRAFT_766655 [Neocallimastix sp. 'constans']
MTKSENLANYRNFFKNFNKYNKDSKSNKCIMNIFQPEDQINRIQNGKHPYNFNKETNSNEYCHYCHKNGHTTETFNKRNFKSYNVNYEEQSNSESDPSFDFCFKLVMEIFLLQIQVRKQHFQHQFSQIKINLEDSTDLMDEYNNENIINDKNIKFLNFKNKLKFSNLNNYKNLSISNLKNYKDKNLNFKNNEIYNKNIKIKDHSSENKFEDNFSNLETLNKRKLRKTKEKTIKFNIKKKKYYQSNEERKMKDRKPILNKSYFEGKTDPGENRSLIKSLDGKIRLVVIDFPQIKGVDYTSTYSSTIEMNSFSIHHKTNFDNNNNSNNNDINNNDDDDDDDDNNNNNNNNN